MQKIILEDSVVDSIKCDILPIIKIGAADMKSVYHVNPKRIDEQSIGYAIWRYLVNYVHTEGLAPTWNYSFVDNDLRLSYAGAENNYTFRLCRLNPKTMLPRAQRAIASAIPNWQYLTREIQTTAQVHREFVIGYLLNGVTGLELVEVILLVSSHYSTEKYLLDTIFKATQIEDMGAYTDEAEKIAVARPVRKIPGRTIRASGE